MINPDETQGLTAEFERLHRYLEFNKGFGLVFAFVDPSDAADQLCLEVKKAAKGWTLYPDPNELTDLFYQLSEAPPIELRYILVFANRKDTGSESHFYNLMGRLNERRDLLRARIQATLILALPFDTANLVRELAPDLWSVRDLALYLSPEKQSGSNWPDEGLTLLRHRKLFPYPKSQPSRSVPFGFRDRLLIVYHSNDRTWADLLRDHLKRWGLDHEFSLWCCDRQASLEEVNAVAVLFLLSDDVLRSLAKEFSALERMGTSGRSLGWILLRSCPWELTPFIDEEPIGGLTPMVVLTVPERKAVMEKLKHRLKEKLSSPQIANLKVPVAMGVGKAFTRLSQATDPDVFSWRANLASLLNASNRLGEAEPLTRRALVISEILHGPNHPVVAKRLAEQGGVLAATGRMKEAEALYRRALAIDEAAFGPDHPNVAARLTDLGKLLATDGRMAEAEDLYRRALTIGEAASDPNRERWIAWRDELVKILRKSDHLEEAEKLSRRLMKG